MFAIQVNFIEKGQVYPSESSNQKIFTKWNKIRNLINLRQVEINLINLDVSSDFTSRRKDKGNKRKSWFDKSTEERKCVEDGCDNLSEMNYTRCSSHISKLK